ncbi:MULTISPECIES: ABC transporter permease [Bosea]|uniref:ABC transporter permease n=1 Tax=Bosea TaxID=85413 RepID=UPI00214FCCB6|nr:MULTISPECIES: ABC transporter permease [Bosea]MCR4523513.1 ABC transporter permease [Bosea sp. 47.2.35]MDR6830449.1 ABC-2 type transport system permease protein [Bosea robiniae]MDR6897204.1 ABC-2 type transport system permease protein [Bosea sp. BE109]MDR7140608.1 ABC-2 type transport system permease protein [Bosea sp. BE168]MDR7177305.1 ABC-2 type transport system permease protein [Bosea sp. BE271]
MAALVIHLQNILRLVVKELRSLRADPIMLVLVAYTFSIAVYTVATGVKLEARDLTIGIVDEDQSEFSRSLLGAFGPPLFKVSKRIAASEIDAEMNSGRLVFVLEIPPKFQADLLARRQTALQLNIDATAMTQAGNGAVYIQQIIAQEIANRQAGRETATALPINLVVRARFNPNLDSGWFSSVMQVLNNVTLLTIILTGAALIREREQGTVEHLLVMPVTPVEIMLAKMVANALVILVAAVASLVLVVEWTLGVPIVGSLLIFVLGTAIYAFSVAALGILLGTLATTMGQFGLLAIPVFVVTQLLSGATTPMESMPIWLQWIMRVFSPTPHFVAFSQGVLYRGAGLDVVWPEIAKIIAIGAAYFAFALARFRKVIFA